MRNITPESPLHNTRTAVLFLGILLAVLGTGGCRENHQETARPAPSSTITEQTTGQDEDKEIGGVVDVAAVTAWEQLARRLLAGERPPLSDYEHLYSLPAQARAYDPVDPSGIRPTVLRNCSEAVFHPEGCSTRKHPKRHDLLDNLAYLKPRLSRLDSLVAELRTRPTNRRIMAICRHWIPARQLPDELNVRLFVGTPQIRYLSNSHDLLVDAGLALACGADRLERTAACRLYQYFVPLTTPEPAAASTGEIAVAAALAKLHREGLTAWIEQYPEFAFDPEHPTLARTSRNRADVVSRAAAAQPRLFEILDSLLNNQMKMTTRGRTLDMYLVGNNRYGEIGYAMAALVADRFGEHVLHETASDPVAFLEAYQRAAAEVDRAPGQLSLLQPLPPTVARQWADLYRQKFPATTRE